MKVSQQFVAGNMARKIVALALGAMIGGVAAPQSHATLIAADSFYTGGVTTSFSIRHTPVGDLPYQYSGSPSQGAGGQQIINDAAYVSLSTVGVLFNAAAYSKSFDMSLEINPGTGDNGTFKLGFWGATWANGYNSADYVLTMIVDSAGNWSLHSGAGTIGAGGNLGTANEWLPVDLAYDTTGVITLNIDGTPFVYNQTINYTEIALAGFNGSSMFGAAQPEFDNFTLSGVVPEPGTIALLGIGSALVWRRRRQQR